MTWRNSKTKAVSHTYNSCNSLNFISFYKKMGQFDKKFRCNKFVQVIDQSQPGVFYLQKWWISVLHSQKWRISWKCVPFIEKITSFYKNSNWHTYKKLHFSNFQKKTPLQLSTKVPYTFLSFYFAWFPATANRAVSSKCHKLLGSTSF